MDIFVHILSSSIKVFQNLREIRKIKKVSTCVLADLLGLETIAAYYKKETGMTKFSLEEAKRIADFFNMQIEEIFFNP